MVTHHFGPTVKMGLKLVITAVTVLKLIFYFKEMYIGIFRKINSK